MAAAWVDLPHPSTPSKVTKAPRGASKSGQRISHSSWVVRAKWVGPWAMIS